MARFDQTADLDKSSGGSQGSGSPEVANDQFNVAGASNAIVALLEANRAYLALVQFLGRTMSEKGYHVNGEQALMLWNIARHEQDGGGKLRPADLTRLGYHMGTNVSYNLTSLANMGMLTTTTSTRDARSKHVNLTPNGMEVAQTTAACFDALDSVLGKYHSDIVLDDGFIRQLREIGVVTSDVARGAFLFELRR